MTDTQDAAEQTAPPAPTPAQSLAAARAGQNLTLAIPAGIAAAVGGAIIWAVSVYVTNTKLGLIAIGVGMVVGYSIRHTGRGVDKVFGYLGGACAAFGWALGTILCDLAFIAKDVGQPMTAVLARVGPGALVSTAFQSADAMDLLFLAIAVWEGYRFSFKYKAKKV